MIKKSMLAACALTLALVANAQNAYDVSTVLGSELNGTARFVGMGGAMGALGGDISVMGTNPAGIGIYRSNDISVSFGFNNTATESNFRGTSMKEDNTRASLDQLGFVYSTKIGNTTSLRYVNFGFNYRKSQNFNRFFAAGGQLDNFSQSWQLAQELENAGVNSSSAFYSILDLDNPYSVYWNQYPVLSVLGATTGVVDWPMNADRPWGWDGYSNHFYSEEKGGIHDYDFNISFNFKDRFYLGATLGVHDVQYDRYSSYTEELNDDFGEANGGYTLENYYNLEGSGIDLKLGAIILPFEDSPFRLGLAVHTPTWYELTEDCNASLSSDILAYDSPYSQNLSDYLIHGNLTYTYQLVTPWKFNLSAGTTLGGLVALGAEYEYADYSSAKLMDMDGYDLGGQVSVDEFLQGVHTFRVGMEARLVPQFSLRAGYNHSSNVFSDDAYSALSLYRTSTDFNNVKARDTFTFGLGYRGDMVYADLAYKYDMYKSDFYAFDDIDLPATTVDNERQQLVFTLGVRF